MKNKKNIKLKSISLILIFTLIFQYMGFIVPLLESVALTIVDSNNIEWEYYISGQDAINVRLKSKDISGDIEVPTTIDGYNVKTVGSEAFENAKNITSITIPECVESIGSNCFKNCENLITINIKSNTINNLIGKFNELGKLQNIIISENNPNYTVDEYGVLFNKDKTQLIKCPEGSKLGSYSIPSTVTYMYPYCFFNCKELASINFPESITSITENTFINCNKLQSLVIYGNIEKIGKNAFSGCNCLEIISIREGVKTIESGAFKKDKYSEWKETDVFLPDSLTSIGSNNFNLYCTIWLNKGTKGETYAKNNNIKYYYNNKEQYTDENGITWEYYIRNGEFAEYMKIKNEISTPNYELIIPSTVGENNYKACIIDSGTPIQNGNLPILSSDRENVKNVIIPSGITAIGAKAFSGFSNMETITIPSSVKEIGEEAFANCDNLTIICDSNSEAYRYAVTNNINVMATTNLSFNEQNLYNKVKQIFNENNYEIINDDTENKKLTVKAEDAEKIKILDISNLEIQDLTGINSLKNLQVLNASGNKLEAINDNTLKIETLEELDLSNNNVAVFSSSLTNLKELNLSGNSINSLSEFKFDKLNNLEVLDLSNNNIINYYEYDRILEPLSQLKSLKTLNLDNNLIRDITVLDEMQENDEFSLENVSLKNQKFTLYTISKEQKLEEFLPIFYEAKSDRYSNGENITFDTVDCEIVNDKIVFSNKINSTDRFATITVRGGKMDGTVCSVKPHDTIWLEKEIEGDRLSITYEGDTPYLFYSIDGSEYKEYEGYVILGEGVHNIKIKFFDKKVLEFDTDEIKIEIHAIRKNGKVYIYSNSFSDKYYSLEKDGNYQKYTGPIENESLEKIYVKLEGQDSNEITIENTQIESEEEYSIYDINAGASSLNSSLRVAFIRENGKLYFLVPDFWKDVTYSVDSQNWNTAVENEKNEIGNDDIETVYFSYYDEYDMKSRRAEIKTISKYSLNESLGIYKENSNSYIFSQDRKSLVNDDSRLQLINDENKIEKINYNVKDITYCYGKRIILRNDGTVHEILSDDNYNLAAIEGGTNIKSISGEYALDNNNNILKLDLNADPIQYKTFDLYTLTKPAQKIFLEVSANEDVKNFDFGNTNNTLLALYEDGKVNVLGNSDEYILSNQAIDADAENGEIYILEYNKVKIVSRRTTYEINFEDVFEDGEIPIKINNHGDILTSKGNVYSIIYRTEKHTDWYGYEYTDVLPDSYSNTNRISNVKKLGNNTYQNNNGDIYYLYHELESTESIPANKLITGLNISKDESKLNQNKVKINIEFEENKFNVKMPDGTQSSNSTTYEVNKNGEYVFEFTDSDGYKFIRVVHVRNIQNRKEIKVPEVIALNNIIELKSDKQIEYSVDEKNSWNNYSEKITYTKPIYTRVKSDENECNILKVTINEEGKLEVLNEDTREVQSGIVTNAIGLTSYQIYNDKTKVIKMAQDASKTISTVEVHPSIFDYISNLSYQIIYSFSATDGKYAGCYFEDNITEMTYKDINNKILDFSDESSLNDIVQTNSDIDYAVIKDNYVVVDKNKYEALTEKTDENLDELAKDMSDSSRDDWIEVKKQAKNYAYIDTNGNLVSNINIINKAKKQIGANTKYVKIVGDGVTFYVLTEDGEVYYLAEADNGNYVYSIEKLRLENNLVEYYKNKEDIIYKLGVNNVVDIYDTLTAKTNDGNIISLINETKQNTSAVQELQKQTDKYLLASHLGLKDGKLYDFANVQQGVEVTKGELYEVENFDSSIGTYSTETKEVKLFKRDVYANPIKNENLKENELYINVQPIEGNLPEFVDIVEYRDTYLTRPSYTIGAYSNVVFIDSGDVDRYARCFAIAKDGKVYAYINGFAIETAMNLDYFGPTANYELSNSNWTKQDLDLKLLPNTSNEIKTATIKKNDSIIESINKADGEVLENTVIDIKTNGTYTYEITDNKDRSYFGTLSVKNIDKLKPYSPSIETVGDKLQVTFNDDKDETEDYAKSGIKERLISYDGTNWTKVNEDINLLDVESDITVFAKAIDNAGNESDISSGRKNIRTGVVIAKYQDMDGQELQSDKIYTGNIGDNYDVQIIEISGYEYKEAIGALNGKYTNTEKTVVLKYQKIQEPEPEPDPKPEKGNVIVIYQDINGNQLRENKTITGNVGESYETEKLEIEGYEFIEVDGQERGTIVKENQFVTYKYKKKDVIETGKVTVKYIDENGNSLKEDVVLTGNVGEDYKTEKVEFEIYKLVEIEGNEQGKYSKEDIEVIYRYNKKEGRIIIIYQDLDGVPIKPDDIIIGKVGEEYSVTRQIIDGYELVEIVGNEQGKYQLADQFVMYKYKKIEVPITVPQTGQSRIAYIIVGIIIIVALCGLIYIKWDDFRSKNK